MRHSFGQGHSTTSAPDLTNWTVYILSQLGRSLFQRPTQGSRQYYTGITTNLKKRIIEHNEGKNKSTKGIEWEIVAHLPGFTRGQAGKVERYLKRGATISKREIFYIYAELYKQDETAAQQYYSLVYPHILKFERRGYCGPTEF